MNLGIDYGTCYSCVARIDDYDQPEVILNADGSTTTASAVFVVDKEQSDTESADGDSLESKVDYIVGEIARDNAVASPERVIIYSKRTMGTDTMYPAGPVAHTAQEAAAIVIRKLMQDVAASLGEGEAEAVITCPAWFGAPGKQATKEAAEMAGLNVLGVIPEPVAAAIAYGYDKVDAKRTMLVYDLGGGTFDITLFTVDPPEEGRNDPHIEMISTRGDHYLGGVDWDKRIAAYSAAVFVKENAPRMILAALRSAGVDEGDLAKAEAHLSDRLVFPVADAGVVRAARWDGGAEDGAVPLLPEEDEDLIDTTPAAIADALETAGLDRGTCEQALAGVVLDPRFDAASHQDLMLKAERAKKNLSRVERTTVSCMHGGCSTAVPMGRGVFARITADLLERTAEMTATLLSDKGYEPDQIDELLLVGGSTRMFGVRDRLERLFPGKVNSSLEPDLCVAQGAARMAKILAAGAGGDGDGVPVLVCPHSYGVKAYNERQDEARIYPLILRDQQLPARSAAHEEREREDYGVGQFFTAVPNQTRVVVVVYENDAETYRDHNPPEASLEIGSVVIDGLPPGRAAGQEIFVTFRVDENTILTVDALDVGTGKMQTEVLHVGAGADVTEEGIARQRERADHMRRVLTDSEVQG